jgi:NhaA family Na+:H+ antiporter
MAQPPFDLLPKEPIGRLLHPLQRFLHIESASGVVLLAATAAALAAANSPFGDAFQAFWNKPFGLRIGNFEMLYSLKHWINDFLMAVFFYVIGLEVKRELVLGELRDARRAAFPIAAALGGMAVPAAIYWALQAGSPGERGWGIPMATDIAFVVGCLAVLGSRVPVSLRIALLSLAIADDIGAILVIAAGYTSGLKAWALLLGLVGLLLIQALMKIGVRSPAVYLAAALFVWYQFHDSGVHATVAGVILGLMTPTRSWISKNRLQKIIESAGHFLQGEGWGEFSEKRFAALRQVEVAARKTFSPLERLESGLHPWVGFVIMPVFALANAGVRIDPDYFFHPVALAVMAGLVVGKPLGIFALSFLAVKTGLARLPQGVSWGVMIGSGCLAGIGFTMALFIAGLAVEDGLLTAAKVGVLAGSALSAIAGMIVLIFLLPKPAQNR